MNPKKNTHLLSLIIPAYRKEKTIVANILRVKEVLEKIRYPYEIIVIIDGMVDNAFEEVKKAHIEKVRCLAYDKNHGKSYAIRFGMHHAVGDYIMFLDAGQEIDPNGISMLLEHMEWYNADIIVGSKRHPASKVYYSNLRKILSYGYYYLVRTLFGVKIHDTQAGIKIFRKKLLEKVLPRLVEKKFAGDLEILVVSTLLGFKDIYEAPIKLDYRFAEVTNAATMRSIIEILIDTMAIFYRAYIMRYYEHARVRITFPEKIYISST